MCERIKNINMCWTMEIEGIRRKETLEALMSFIRRRPCFMAKKYLDLGCGDGTFTVMVAKALSTEEIHGVDVNREELAKAKIKGIQAYGANLNSDTLHFDEEFGVVSAFDVIEHLWNADNLLSNAYRALKRGGHFIITTPNLASWANRLPLLFGYLPYHYECSLSKNVEKRPLQKTKGVEGHIRLYTFKTLEEHLKSYGFKIIHSTNIRLAYTSSNPVVKVLDGVLGMKKTLGGAIFLVATKT